jgi:outer membrane lipoprotein carrier protein
MAAPDFRLSLPFVELQAALGIAAALLLAAPPPSAPAAAEALLRRIEERHRQVADLTARFTQTYRSGMLGREVVEKGRLMLKRPGRMRWEYTDPEPKTFVADGERSFFYVPADRQVVVHARAGDRGVAAFLLSGRGSLVGEFEPALEAAASGRERLRLTPRKPDADIERVYLEADAAGRIRSIEILDAQGNRSEFAFDDVKENVGLPDKLFRFDVPKGVEVVSG